MNRDNIRQHIAKGRLAEALKIMLSELPADQQTEIFLWQNRLNKLDRDERLGTVSRADASLERNRLVAAVLDFLSKDTELPLPNAGNSSDRLANTVTAPTRTPVIFTAFANPKGDLINLNKEQNGIQDILMPLEQAGKIKKHLVRTDTDIDAYFDFLRQWKSQICIFHYAGHANSEGILLQNAHTFFEPLARELTDRNRDSLQLVFLNGCSTHAHIKTLFGFGVKAVIATSISIDDDLATRFALRFYKNLAGDDTLESAYESAANYIKGRSSEQRFRYFGGLIRDVNVAEQGEQAPEGGKEGEFPWGLYINGDESILKQTFFSTTNSPLNF